MKAIKGKIRAVESGYGWMNRILRIDLSSMQISAHESEHLYPTFLGGRGFAAKIAWDEYPQSDACARFLVHRELRFQSHGKLDKRWGILITPGWGI